ncbi:HAD hydrolase-like protein [Pseudodesulfovibrio cashew]|uniref:phosphoglycolate phosphatase n=1 Tax=Pseudodesulfovibrio cashew TaxID=2678688 RepID=A0A6I6JGL0_9BACT|nr:HAD hydrolase-like protein [Pseudodesulfovibrio cashew]QGY39197.1 HAD hydrolase-like protein [Pseudodesulfovibrio cashew]
MTDFSTIPELAAAKAVIFDCDGVLIESWASTMYYFNHVRRAVGLGPMDAELEEYCFIHTIDESLAHMVPPELLDRAMAAKLPMPFDGMIPLIELQPGIIGFLESLRRAGKLLAVDTNGGEEQYEILRANDLLDRFDLIVTADDVARGKPSPDGPRLILDHFALTPEEALFVGDSIMDQGAADATGIPFWAYRNPALSARRHIDDYASLLG